MLFLSTWFVSPRKFYKISHQAPYSCSTYTFRLEQKENNHKSVVECVPGVFVANTFQPITYMILLHSCYNWYQLCHRASSMLFFLIWVGMCEKNDPVINKHHTVWKLSGGETTGVKEKNCLLFWTLTERTYCKILGNDTFNMKIFLLLPSGVSSFIFRNQMREIYRKLSCRKLRFASFILLISRYKRRGGEMIGRRQAEQSEITALMTDLSLYSHLSLWHRQVEVVEDLQLAVRPAHISALDRRVLPSSRQSGLQVSLHVPVLQLQERKYCKKKPIENDPDDYYRTIILGWKYQHFNNSCHENAFFCGFHGYFDETSEGLPSMFSGVNTEHHDRTSGHFPKVLFGNRTKQTTSWPKKFSCLTVTNIVFMNEYIYFCGAIMLHVFFSGVSEAVTIMEKSRINLHFLLVSLPLTRHICYSCF